MTYTVTVNGSSTLPKDYHYEVRDGEIMFHLGILGTHDYFPSHPKDSPYSGIAPGEIIPDPTSTAYDLGSHTVEILQDGNLVKQYTLSKHIWASRWFHPLRVTVSKNTTKQLQDALVIPPYGDPGFPVAFPGTVTWNGPQDTAQITRNGTITGGRPDIGFFNEWSIKSILTNDLSDMINTANGCFALPIFFRDERTGQCQDIVKWPGSTIGSAPGQQGLPWINRGPQQDIQVDDAHMIECGAAAYAYTEEPRYLELIQYASVYAFLTTSYYSNYRDGVTGNYYIQDGACIGPNQTRACAWTLRSLTLAEVLTRRLESQGPLPSYLKPSSFFKTIINNHLDFFTRWYMNDPANQVARVFTHTGKAGFWQENFKHFTLSYMAAHYPEWRPLYLWGLGQVISMTNGKSGFPPAAVGTYYVPLGPTLDNDPPDLGRITPSMVFSDWSQIWENYAKIQINGTAIDGGGLNQSEYDRLKADQYNNLRFIRGGTDYAANPVATLAYAVYLDRNKIVDISSTYPELEQCYASQYQMWVNSIADYGQGGTIVARSAVSVSPQALNTLPSTPQTPENPPTMSQNFSDLTAAVHSVTAITASVVDAVQKFVAKIAELTAAGTPVDPAAIDALTTELQSDVTALTNAASQAPNG